LEMPLFQISALLGRLLFAFSGEPRGGGFKQSMQHSYEGVQRGCHTPAFSAVVH